MKIENGRAYIFNSKYMDLARYNDTKVRVEYPHAQISNGG